MKTTNSFRGRFWLLCGVLVLGLKLPLMAATLTNRYSFTTDVTDSISGKNGTLVNGTFSGGQAVLASGILGSGDPSGQYVDLPDNLISNYSAVTVETWVTPTLDDATAGAFWARIWDFGNSDGVNGITGFFWFRVGNNNNGLRGDVVPPALPGGVVDSPSTLIGGQENHIVWTSDGNSSHARIYLNGVLVGANDNFPATPQQMGQTTNDWLGRSQFAADAYMNGSFNEFRIYSGTLNPLEVAADFQNGADTYPANVGTVTSVALSVPSPISLGAGVSASVKVGTTALTNTINIADSQLIVSYLSGNTNIITVNSNGIVNAVAAGTTTVIATFSSISSTQSVTVVALPTKLIHRYSFTSDVTDEIGGANGTLLGNATIAGGKAMLDGTAPTYVELPSYLIASSNLANGAFTIEAWATIYPTTAAWANLFAFGNSVGGAGSQYAFMVPRSGDGFTRFAVGSAGGEDLAQQAGITIGVTNFHFLCVFNPNPGRHFEGIYVNGALVGQNNAPLRTLASINNAFSWLGRSTYFAFDPTLPGEIDEFRIYDGELDKFQIAASFQSGPNVTNHSIGTFSGFSFNLGTPTLAQSEFRQAVAVVNFTLATNVNVVGDAALTITSSDTNVLTVTSPGGLVQGNGLGTATLTAVYQYITSTSTNSFTNSAALTVFIPPAQLRHRYAFNETSGTIVHDSVGTSDGTLVSATGSGLNTSWSGSGQLIINTNTGTADTYVDLPDGLVSVLTSNATFEVWVTDFGSGLWARFWDFGSAGGQPNIFLDRQSGGAPANLPRFDWSQGNIQTPLANAMPNGVLTHLVVLYNDGDNSAQLYKNGVLMDQSLAVGLPLNSITDTNNWLGRSQFADPFLLGSYDEFRIYSGLLTVAEIQKHFANGPNALITDVGLTTSVSGGNVTITWPTYGAHFTLQSSPSLSSPVWTPVAATVGQTGANYRVTVPATGTTQFYRMLRQW